MPIPYHPLAELFPLMEGAAFEELVADIKANGLVHPLTVCDGMLLDGRNRLRACEEAGVPATYELYAGPDPLGFVSERRPEASGRQPAGNDRGAAGNLCARWRPAVGRSRCLQAS